MKGKVPYGIICGLGIAIAIHLLSKSPHFLETYYARLWYPLIAKAQRILTGWLPFSVGDLLYASVVIGWLVYIYGWWKQHRGSIWSASLLRRTAFLAAGVIVSFYILFNITWGMNYNRPPLGKQFKLHTDSISKEDMRILLQHLVVTMNGLYDSAHAQPEKWASSDAIFDESKRSYALLAHQRPSFQYRHPSVKASLFGILGNYMGYGGYYNPFTGEAQVNTAAFPIQQPFITCHEIAHQLGYAKENEANMVGFLAARSSQEPYFRYSVYFDLYAYGRPYLKIMDSTALKKIEWQLHPGIKEEYMQAEKFYARYHTPIDTFTDWLYSHFLKVNQQPEGQQSYHRIIGWLVAYYKKYGIEAI